jgi:hypothetical protein
MTVLQQAGNHASSLEHRQETAHTAGNTTHLLLLLLSFLLLFINWFQWQLYQGLQVSHNNPAKHGGKKKFQSISLSNDPPVSETALHFRHKDKHSHNLLWRTNANLIFRIIT